jgi:hypothetical protein
MFEICFMSPRKLWFVPKNPVMQKKSFGFVKGTKVQAFCCKKWLHRALHRKERRKDIAEPKELIRNNHALMQSTNLVSKCSSTKPLECL